MAPVVYPEDPIEVGKRLRQLRHALGYLSPQKWLDFLNGEVDGNFSKGQWLHWEKGERTPDAQDIGMISRATGMNSAWLIHGDTTVVRADLLAKLRATPVDKLPPPRPSTRGKATG